MKNETSLLSTTLNIFFVMGFFKGSVLTKTAIFNDGLILCYVMVHIFHNGFCIRVKLILHTKQADTLYTALSYSKFIYLPKQSIMNYSSKISHPENGLTNDWLYK